MARTKHKKENRLQAGFTLIETFMAITILLIAMTGPLVLVTTGLAVSKMAKGQVTAMYLAQEAVEYIRNVRDSNILTGNNWLDGLEDCIDNFCKIDSPNEEISICGSSGCNNLDYNEISLLFGYSTDSGWVNSRFEREIEIVEITNNKEMEIVVNMYWNDGPKERQFIVKEKLLNWQ